MIKPGVHVGIIISHSAILISQRSSHSLEVTDEKSWKINLLKIGYLQFYTTQRNFVCQVRSLSSEVVSPAWFSHLRISILRSNPETHTSCMCVWQLHWGFLVPADISRRPLSRAVRVGARKWGGGSVVVVLQAGLLPSRQLAVARPTKEHLLTHSSLWQSPGPQ